jgi:hypothetical protein
MDLVQNSDKLLIAPCGMNCGICMGYLRERNKCMGCRIVTSETQISRVRCVIKNCSHLKETASGFCYDCKVFPCKRMKDLDKRYRTKYGMSMIENLGNIKKSGLDDFVIAEDKRWKCPQCGGTICVHKGYCLKCKGARLS